MTAKRYLSQAIFLRSMIRRVEEQIEEIRTRATSVGGIRYDKISVQTSPRNAMESFVIQLEKAEKKQLEVLSEYYSTYANIQAQIAAISPEVYRQILTLRYLDGMKLERIADLMGYSDVYVRKLHGRALQAFDRQYGISG